MATNEEELEKLLGGIDFKNLTAEQITGEEFSEKYVANYTEGGRGVADGFGWLFWTAPALVAGLVPSDWDHQMKDDAVKQLRKVFGKGLHFTVMDTLNSISATDKI